MTKPGWSAAVRSTVVPAVALLAIAACAPEDYAGSPEQGTAATQANAPEPEIVGGADPTAVSGRIRAHSEDTIHHPGADGNAGRAPDEAGTVTEAAPGGTPATAPAAIPHQRDSTAEPRPQAAGQAAGTP